MTRAFAILLSVLISPPPAQAAGALAGRAAVPVRLTGALGAAGSAAVRAVSVTPALSASAGLGLRPALPRATAALPAAMITQAAQAPAALSLAPTVAPAAQPARGVAATAGAGAAAEAPQPKLASVRPVRAALRRGVAGLGHLFDGEGKGGEASFEPAPVRSWNPGSARSLPAVPGVRFAEGISAEQRALFDESLRRRKSAWFRELAKVGIRLDGPDAPKLLVREAADAARGEVVAFSVDWEQTPVRAGSFRAAIRRKDAQPALSRRPDPPVAEERKLKVRFLDSVPDAEARRLLEERGLRWLGRDWKGPHLAAVTGGARAAGAARALAGLDAVLYAAAVSEPAPPRRRLSVVFKSAADQAAVRGVLRAEGLRVVEADRDGGRYAVSVGPKDTPARAAERLRAHAAVLYAAPAGARAAEPRQLVLRFRRADYSKKDAPAAASEDEIADFLNRHALRVVEPLGDNAFRVSGRGSASGIALAKRLAGDPLVSAATPVGTLGDAEVAAAAKGAAFYKGGTWSATEFNLNSWQYKQGLILRGATRAQLDEFERLLAAAPVLGGRFNPWSGD